jgi:DNA-binding CsgD family transcriptional regulator
VPDAEADARIASGLAHEYDWDQVIPFTSSHLADALMQAGALEEAAEVLAGAGAESAPSVPDYLDSLGRLNLARSKPEIALGQFLACGRQLTARGGVDAPGIVAWRSHAAMALTALGEVGRARELAGEELKLAEDSGIIGSIGVASAALGVAHGGAAGIAWLEKAVDALERSPRALAWIDALIELGAMTRRLGQPRAARPHLTRALDLARRHGATMLGERARVELLAAGGRPRRDARTGIDSLTASERRVAELTASGLSNRQIAHQLYVSMRTVATHLTHIYQKLQLSGREEIAGAIHR